MLCLSYKVMQHLLLITWLFVSSPFSTGLKKKSGTVHVLPWYVIAAATIRSGGCRLIFCTLSRGGLDVATLRVDS